MCCFAEVNRNFVCSPLLSILKVFVIFCVFPVNKDAFESANQRASTIVWTNQKAGFVRQQFCVMMSNINIGNGPARVMLCLFRGVRLLFETAYDDTAQGVVKEAILCFRNLHFYFRHGESTSTASQLTSPASQKSKDLNKVPLLLQDLDYNPV